MQLAVPSTGGSVDATTHLYFPDPEGASAASCLGEIVIYGHFIPKGSTVGLARRKGAVPVDWAAAIPASGTCSAPSCARGMLSETKNTFLLRFSLLGRPLEPSASPPKIHQQAGASVLGLCARGRAGGARGGGSVGKQGRSGKGPTLHAANVAQ